MRHFANLCAVVVCLLVLGLLPGCSSKASRPPSGAVVPGTAGPGVFQQPTVSIQGEVRHPVVPWSEDLRLSQALDAAEYTGRYDPLAIYIVHQGKMRYVSPRRLISGADDPVLEPGDVVQIRR
jgi:hypothetical protein